MADEQHDGPSADMAALIAAIKAEGGANRQEEKSEDRAKRWREWITIVLLGATLIALVLQVREMIRVYDPISTQANAAKITADEAAQQLEESQRAWAGPGLSKIDGTIAVNTDINIQTTIQNTGREPALNFTHFEFPFLTTDADDKDGNLSKSIANFVTACRSRSVTPNAQVLYPSVGFGGGFTYSTSVDKKFVTKDVIDGSKIVVVPGCLVYETFKKTRHSTFCYFYKGGYTKPENLNLCNNGSTAD